MGHGEVPTSFKYLEIWFTKLRQIRLCRTSREVEVIKRIVKEFSHACGRTKGWCLLQGREAWRAIWQLQQNRAHPSSFQIAIGAELQGMRHNHRHGESKKLISTRQKGSKILASWISNLNREAIWSTRERLQTHTINSESKKHSEARKKNN